MKVTIVFKDGTIATAPEAIRLVSNTNYLCVEDEHGDYHFDTINIESVKVTYD